MDILVVGSGGREHAICQAFRNSARTGRLYCANGNAGIAEVAECIPILPDDIEGLAGFAALNKIGLTFVGGEAPLARGIVDLFASKGLPIVGPRKQAALLESSKSFAKDFMSRHGIPTAHYLTAHTPAFAIDELDSGDFGSEQTPVVVKADGLAAGKGVVVAQNRKEAIEAINGLEGLVGTDASQKIVIEECLFGTEVSMLMFVDGEDFALMPAVRDHKRLGDGDIGPNTGGMGTFTDIGLISSSDVEMVIDRIVKPTLHGCTREGFHFRGVLFLGLMMTTDGPKLLEYNVRFGDPEAQAILVRLGTDLVDICTSILSGSLKGVSIDWRKGSSACVVLASKGYPYDPTKRDLISGLDLAASLNEVKVFHGGTAFAGGSEFRDTSAAAGVSPQYITSGGRVLGVTATGNSLGDAVGKAYSAVEHIHFEGMQFRHDIGKPIAK